MIEVKNLWMHYGKFPALKDISFHVKQGDIFGFIGPNGAGKTTTIKILATLLEPTRGRAFINGKCVVNQPEEVRSMIGYMPDYFGVYRGITVREYLDFFAGAYKIERRRRRKVIRDVMELTDLVQIAGRDAASLSKGMKQRLCLGKALINDPRVLILDEPAAGLDPRARVELRDLIKELARMGKTIFISSHILTELSDMCNTVGIIEQGKMLISGDIETIMSQVHPTLRFVIRMGGEPGDVKPLLGEVPGIAQIEQADNTLTVDIDGDEALIGAVVQALVQKGISITGVEREQRDLESLFLRVTRGRLA